MVPDVAVLVECLVRMQHAAEPSQSSRSLVTQSLGYIPYADRFQHRRSILFGLAFTEAQKDTWG